MRLFIDYRGTALLSVVLLGLLACESTPPPSPSASAAPTADAAPVAAPEAPPLPPLPEALPQPPPVPEKPAAVRPGPSPRLSELPSITEEPDSPFGDGGRRIAAPPEVQVALSDAPIPTPPRLPEPPRPAPVLTGERPEISPPSTTSVSSPPAARPSSPPPAAAVPAAPVVRPTPPPSEPPLKEAPIAKESPAAAVPELPARPAPAASEDRAEFSREARLMVGQLLEIPYRGSGWIFLGEQGAKKGLPYDSRRLDRDGQSFMFRAELAGVYALKFYRQDFVNDYIVNDYVRVTVEPAPETSVIGGFSSPIDRGRVVAEPRWPPVPGSASGGAPAAAPPGPSLSAAPAAPPSAPPAAATNSPNAASSSAPPAGRPDSGIFREVAVAPAPAAVPSSAAAPAPAGRSAPPALPDNASVEEFLSAARAESDAGRAASALSILDRFRAAYPAGSDEAWWLYGKLLEANGPAKDVKASLSYYRRLVDEFPQSPRYDEARRRIAYLERFYFEIR